MQGYRLLLVVIIAITLAAGFSYKNSEPKAVFLRDPKISWADSIFNTLSPDERIAQLFMVAAYSNKDRKHEAEVESLIVRQKIGGLIFFQGGPYRQAKLTNRFQKASKVPLMISIDGEWGLGMRLDSTISFPRQMTLGAIRNDSLIYQMGKEIARQCKRLGIHVNLAPVADVNNNPRNPVIGTRSFGEDKYNVSRKAIMYMKGMQDAGILANAKHFPGHGDTDKDSHKTLPLIMHSRERLDSLELYPFREMIKNGLGSMMVAHLYIPALDTTANTASTLSPKIVSDLLKKEMGFDGLIFTDALNMKGVSKYFKAGEVDVKALLAGNDVLLFSEDVPKAIAEIKIAIAEGKITQDEIDRRCIRILKAKEWCGLDRYKPVVFENLASDLNTGHADWLCRSLSENALTLVKDEHKLLPLMRLDTLSIATVALGSRSLTAFQEMVSNYATVTHYNLGRNFKRDYLDSMMTELPKYDLLLVSVHNLFLRPEEDYGFVSKLQSVMNELLLRKRCVLTMFANPYILTSLDSARLANALIMGYEESSHSMETAAQGIFGGIRLSGTLPVTASVHFKAGSGMDTGDPLRLKFTMPEEFDANGSSFAVIDSLVLHGIKEKAYPGGQLLIAKDGKVIHYKTYGHHTYSKKRSVKKTDMYDLASITKIASSTAAMMMLVQQKKVKLDDHLCYHLPELEGCNKMNIVIREMMTHQSGLKDWIPFWTKTVKKGVYKPGVYSTDSSSNFPYRVAERLYISKTYRDSIWKRILDSDLNEPGEFKYSDLGYYFIQKIIENNVSTSLDKYVASTFYSPMGLPTMCYKPRERFKLRRIVPTEYDAKFRKQLVWGDVHDQGAAMMGGVAGHAGLFSNAADLAVMMQMYMQYGTYGGKRYIDSAVVSEFISCQYCPENRRGIGFDKPEPDPKKGNPVCDCASALSFGHTGFTGTFAWADPKEGIVIVFLTNRVYPDAETNKLVKLGTRTLIMQEVYRLLGKKRS